MKQLPSIFSFLFFLSFIATGLSQSPLQDQDLLAVYEEYTALPREVAYVHLNKSTFIKGEDIGFQGYVLDKQTKLPSKATTNLYCTLLDKNGAIVKSKLVSLRGGVGEGFFKADSLFTSGEYVFKAYTNWMRNFKEQNFYVQAIKIIDPEVNATEEVATIDAAIDFQLLPEGGHLVSDAKNTIGVIAKDASGYGIPDMQGEIVNAKNDVVTTFKTSKFGIAKFTFKPKKNSTYNVRYTYLGKEFTAPIEDIKSQGLVMALHDLKTKVALHFSTNKKSLSQLKGRNFKLEIHDGKTIKETAVIFDDNVEVYRVIPYGDLSPGINIFTLFDESNNPVLERLFFKHDGLSFATSQDPVLTTEADSLQITIPFSGVKPDASSNLSVSVLPTSTKSYHQDHNLPSYTLLQPYVKGEIQNAAYYFTDITPRKKYELDNLLITQGWSSYSWYNLFRYPPIKNYNFERGITYTINTNAPSDSGSKQFILFPSRNSDSETITIPKGQKSFKVDGYFPEPGEKVRIGALDQEGKLQETKSLYLQFQPSAIPDLKYANEVYNPIKENTILNSFETILPDTLLSADVQQLEEVVVLKNKRLTKLEKIKDRSNGSVVIFDERSSYKYPYFSTFIRQYGFAVDETQGNFSIFNRTPNSPNNNVPTIILDGIRLQDFQVLYRYNLANVAYIEVNKSGLGEGIRAGGGVIRIVNDPLLRYRDKKTGPLFSETDVPLAFSATKKFYVPKYNSYENSFFLSYGVIDWIPNMKLDETGQLHLKINNNKIPAFNLHIEGVLEDGTFISETKRIEVKQDKF